MSFSEEIVQRVWEKGTVVPGADPDVWRKDQCGAWINRSSHSGRRDNPVSYEWEIDHIDPNGGDDISNLQPLQWKNNLDKGENRRLTCPVTSDGNRNVLRQ
jgi:hypothetical protein